MPTPPVPTRFDPFYGDGQLRWAYQTLVDGRWDAFERALARQPGGWLLRSILTSDDAAIETIAFQRFADARPTAPALALLGGAMVRDAFDPVCAAGDADQEKLLGEAEVVLRESARADPRLADPRVHLVTSGRGLGVGLEELKERFVAAHDRELFRPDAGREYLLGLSPRNGGSDAAMLGFARWVEGEAPPDSPAREALPRAHLELALKSGQLSSEYLASADTVAELSAGLTSFLNTIPPTAEPVHLQTLNAYGLAMTVTDASTAHLLKECFRRIANRPTTYPWSLYVGEPITSVFTEVQHSQLRLATGA